MTFESLSHSRFDCKYHLVFVPKYRKKKLYGEIRSYLGPVFHELAQQKGCTILKGNMVQDHVHMLIQLRPDVSVSKTVQLFKGKSSYIIRKEFPHLEEFYWGKADSFWGDGFFVETVGQINETTIKEYIRNQ